VIISATPTTIFMGRCTACVLPVRRTNPAVTGRYDDIPCPQCGATVRGERLHGTVNADPCHGRCMSAIGSQCSCSCGGDNHGGLWEYKGEEYESEVAAYRARMAKEEAERQRRRAAEHARKLAAFQQWAADWADVVAFLDGPGRDSGSDFLLDMVDQVDKLRPLTINQAEAVRRRAEQHTEYERRRAAEAAEEKKPVPAGNGVTIAGEIIATRVDETFYTYSGGVSVKMLVHGDGWKVWSTVPASLITADVHVRDLRYRRVEFVANVTASDDDPSFGFAKRPRKASLLPIPA
jgi:hypothetical protein